LKAISNLRTKSKKLKVDLTLEFRHFMRSRNESLFLLSMVPGESYLKVPIPVEYILKKVAEQVGFRITVAKHGNYYVLLRLKKNVSRRLKEEFLVLLKTKMCVD
jgi:hypothetical protein